MLDFIQNKEVLIALLSGGALAKLVDYLLPALINKNKRAESLAAVEKENLRKDIEFLRGQIEELRREVAQLREDLTERNKDVSFWQRLYWDKKVKLDRLLLQIRHHDDKELREKIKEVLEGDEAVSIDNDV